MKAFFDRDINTIEGWFSIVAPDGTKLVNRVRARSGQKGYTNTSWTRSKSPIPFGEFNLYTTLNNKGLKAGKTGIGEAFPIDNRGDKFTIKQPGGKLIREEIMLHQENMWDGSAGCIVIVRESDWLHVKAVMEELRLRGIAKFPVEVL